MANGNPSNRRHNSATTAVLSSVSAKSGRSARARAANSATESNRSNPAGFAPGSGSGSGGTTNSISPARSSGSRLVARIFSAGQPRSNASARTADTGSRCSQLSSTSRACRPARCRTNCSTAVPAPG